MNHSRGTFAVACRVTADKGERNSCSFTAYPAIPIC